MNNPIICELHGDTRIFATINTAEYNGDGRYSVQVTDYSNVESMGWSKDTHYTEHAQGRGNLRVYTIDEMAIGTIVSAEEYGAYLMRLA